jgi:hypothetical protein
MECFEQEGLYRYSSSLQILPYEFFDFLRQAFSLKAIVFPSTPSLIDCPCLTHILENTGKPFAAIHLPVSLTHMPTCAEFIA